MKKLLLLLFINVAYAETPVVLKKNELIICPVTQETAYKVVETIREGLPIKATNLIDVDTGKHPVVDKDGTPFKCQSVATSWFGYCIYTKNGWKPELCKKVLRINPTFQPLIVE